MELEEARCLLCFMPVGPGQQYLVVYMANPEHPSIAATQNRAGVVHLRHLQNVFNPDMIAVQVTHNPMSPTNGHDVRVQVAL